jgi:nucleoside-diphosphate-sugar epimerase
MRILVAGGAGFLGANLCRYLLEKGNSVVCVDSLATGNKANITGMLGNPRFEFIEQDIIKPLSIECKLDHIYHLASRASPPNYQSEPIHTMLTNAIGTNNLLRLALEKKAVFLMASTSEVYGDPEEHPQKESYWGHVNPTGIRSCYDESKRFAEALCMAYHRRHKVPIRIVRIFNTYGPYMQADDGRVVSNLINQALSNRPMTIYGDGTQTRSFCYVDDEVEGLYRLMNSKVIGPVNIGNPNEITVLEIAKHIRYLTGTKSKIVFKPLPQDDPIRRRPDIALAKKELGWEPKISLDEGLKRTIAYFRAIRRDSPKR